MLLILLNSLASAAPCPDVEAQVTEAEAALVEARLADVEAALAEAEAAFVCARPPETQLLARFWLAEGAMYSINEDEAGAADSFAAAHRVAPDHWNASLGEDMRADYEAAAAADPGQGTLRLEPAPRALVGWVDGSSRDFPVDLAAGLHLVQVGPRKQPARFGRIVYLPPGDTLVLDHPVEEPLGLFDAVGLPEPEPVVEPEPEEMTSEGTESTEDVVEEVVETEPVTEPPPPVPPEPDPPPITDAPVPTSKPPTFAIAGGTIMALGGASLIAALAQNGAMNRAETPDEVNEAYSRQRFYGNASYTLFGVGAVVTILHIAR